MAQKGESEGETKKIAYVAGCCASFLCIASVVIASSAEYWDSDIQSSVLLWVMILGAFSSVICLVSAFFDFLKNRKRDSK